MESFSLLKYWRPSGGGATVSNSTQTIVTAAVSPCSSSDGEDGPYFDLEFALPKDQSDTEEEYSEIGTAAGKLSENESENSDGMDGNERTLSPGTDELLFKGNVVSVHPSSITLNETEENSKFPLSLAKSATKFRVLLLKLKKSKTANGFPDEGGKSETIEANGHEIAVGSREIEEKQGKFGGMFLTVKCKVEEVGTPLVSLFTRDKDNSAKVKNEEGVKHKPEDSDSTTAAAAGYVKKPRKKMVQKYLKIAKPLYVLVSKRYADKLKFSEQLSFTGGAPKGGSGSGGVRHPAEKGRELVQMLTPSNVKPHDKKQTGLKNLGKSRSASDAEAPPPQGKTASSRRDDSLLQLHDGIQGAILHCKRSFNASRDGESSDLSRTDIDGLYEKAVTTSADSSSPPQVQEN